MSFCWLKTNRTRNAAPCPLNVIYLDTYDAYEILCYLYRPTKLLVVINLQNTKVKKLNFVVRQASRGPKQFSIFHSLLDFFTVINIYIAHSTIYFR